MRSLLVCLLLILTSCNQYVTKSEQQPSADLPSLMARTVQVITSCEGEDKGSGSAVLISDTLALSAYHVVDDACEQRIEKNGFKAPAFIKKVDKDHDLVLLAGNFFKVGSLGLYLTGEPGDDVVCIGYPIDPLSEETVFTVSKGSIISIDIDYEGHRFIRTDAIINFGSSGGPCFTYDGYLVGIVDMLVLRQDGAYYLEPAEYVLPILYR